MIIANLERLQLILTAGFVLTLLALTPAVAADPPATPTNASPAASQTSSSPSAPAAPAPAKSPATTAVAPAGGAGSGAVAPIIPTKPSGAIDSVEGLVKNLFSFGITVGGVAFLLLFLIGGLTYLSAAGNEDQTGKAKRMMIDAVIGLVLVLGSWAIARFIGRELGAF